MQESRIVFIDFTNYEDYPIGGYLSFAKNMIEAFGPQLALVGISTCPKEPVGKWFKKEIDGLQFDFFAMARYKKSKTKHIIPDRLATYFLVRIYDRKINKIGIGNVFLQRHEILLALRAVSRNICFSFAGLENPLSISKYWYGKLVARHFERSFFKKLGIVSAILARGDDNAIEQLVRRSGRTLPVGILNKFPTRINSKIYIPGNKEESRLTLSLPLDQVIIVTIGRLAEFKGWRFMIDCFNDFNRNIPASRLYFVGEGEDYQKIKTYIVESKLENRVLLVGKQNQQVISTYLNAADMFIMGSVKEGWSTSLMEAIACGVPSCVTDFSSATDIIIEGLNGYVVKFGNRKDFVENMKKALCLPRPVESGHIRQYSTVNLKRDILKYWILS